MQYCGRKTGSDSRNQIKGGKKTKLTVKKVNGKKLDTKKDFRIYVAAYKIADGKKITLAKSITAHVVGKDNKKHTNVKTVRIKKSVYVLKKGKKQKYKQG